MKKLIFCLSFLFVAPAGPAAADDAAHFFKFFEHFNPQEKKQEVCQDIQLIKTALACRQEKENAAAGAEADIRAECSPSPAPVSKDPGSTGSIVMLLADEISRQSRPVFAVFENVSAFACSFECSAGKEMCNETINPDRKPLGFPPFVGFRSYEYDEYYPKEYADARPSSSCGDMINQSDFEGREPAIEEVITETDEDGHEYITRITRYEDDQFSCEDHVTHLIIHDAVTGERSELEEYSPEWHAYMAEFERKKARQRYKDTCFTPSEKDCAGIKAEQTQCMLDIAEQIDQGICRNLTNPLWLYREIKNMEINKMEGKATFDKQNMEAYYNYTDEIDEAGCNPARDLDCRTEYKERKGGE